MSDLSVPSQGCGRAVSGGAVTDFFSVDGGLGQELKELLLMRGLRGRDILAETLLAGID